MRWELIKLVLFVIRIFMCIIIYVVIEVMLLNFGKSFFILMFKLNYDENL